jgi:hypothetical protein
VELERDVPAEPVDAAPSQASRAKNPVRGSSAHAVGIICVTPDPRPSTGAPVPRLLIVQPRSRAGAIAFAIAVLASGGVFVVFGLVLLLALAAAGTVLGAGIVLYRRLTGRLPRFLRPAAPASSRSAELGLEVFPDDTAETPRHRPQLPDSGAPRGT